MAPNPSPITSSILRTPEFIIETLSPNSFPPPQQSSPRPVESSIKKQLHLLLSLLKGNKCGTRSSREIRGMQVINFRLAAGGGVEGRWEGGRGTDDKWREGSSKQDPLAVLHHPHLRPHSHT